MSDPLSRINHLFAVDIDGDRLAAINAARANGYTWQDIAEAMGHTDRRHAKQWHRRQTTRRAVQDG